jgi:hypothetical protein
MIYISGRISEDMAQYAKDRKQFMLADEYLHECRVYENEIINPIILREALPNLTYEQYMDIALVLLRECDTIYMLQKWETGIESRVEHEYAVATNKKITYSKKY